MSKIKKILAVLVTLAMVIAMAVPAFALTKTSATITVVNEEGNALTGAALSYVQVIKADPTTRTGWAFVNDTLKGCYTNAFNNSDDQAIIDKLIAYAAGIIGESAATTTQIAAALSNVVATNSLNTMRNPQIVTAAGVYAIKAAQEGYTYNNMAAYVGFGEVKDASGNVINEYPSLLDTNLSVKRTPTDLTKETTDADSVVAIGDIVTYTISTTVPFIDPQVTNKSFIIWDKIISGAEYYLTGDGAVASVKMGGSEIQGVTFERKMDTTDPADPKEMFEINLSSLITSDNTNAGKNITVTYTVKVTAQTVENQAGSRVSGEDVATDTENVYTGRITLTKYAFEDANKKLAGAKFVVYKVNDDQSKSKSYTTFDASNKFVEWVSEEINATQIVTDDNGIVTVEGLDLGTYWFKEVEAPKGYSKNTTDVSAELKLSTGESKATAIVTASTHMIDTKLGALPSTGGIGTTIFTVGGCLIMIAAAALFFINRRKASK